MKLDVVKNAKRNMVFGLFNKIIVMVCPFVVRTIVQQTLGAHFLGLDSLFTSILAVLSLSEMGFSSAIAYNMYKPVAEGNTEKVNALLAFYRNAYYIIGSAILVLGLFVIPFLPDLINGSYPKGINLTVLYLMYLVNASISYFTFGYLTVLITVYQREDINSTINSVIVLLQAFCRIVILLGLRNYYLYILMLPIFTIFNNLWLGYIVKKRFPQYRCKGSLSETDLSNIKQLVTGTFIQKACAVTRNSLDSICISFFMGLTLTAVYSNYLYISNAVAALMGIVTTAFIGGVGNHVAIKTVKENFDELQRIDFIYLWLSGWCTVCLMCLYQPFMEIWMGESMMLNTPSVVLLCSYFYLLKLGDMRSMYNAANGLWWKQKWRSMAETLLNLVLNIMLGKYFGVNGIIIATIISLFLCNHLWATQILFKQYYNKIYLRIHYFSQIKYSIVTLIVCLVTYFVCQFVTLKSDVVALFIKLGVCIVVPNVIYLLAYHKNNTFIESINTLFAKGKRHE